MMMYVVSHSDGTKDKRYTITLEHTGHEKPHYVVRFCDEWVGSRAHYGSAVMLAVGEHARRRGALTFENMPE
jgi:hypothetical protein